MTMSRLRLSSVEGRVALESSIIRLRRVVQASLASALAGLVLVTAVLPHVQGPLRRPAVLVFSLLLGLGLFLALSCSILVWDQRRGLKELEGDLGED